MPGPAGHDKGGEARGKGIRLQALVPIPAGPYQRHERRSVLITTNLAFLEWPKVFGGGEKLTTAALDRLAHNATVITTKGSNYRSRLRAKEQAEEVRQRMTTGR